MNAYVFSLVFVLILCTTTVPHILHLQLRKCDCLKHPACVATDLKKEKKPKSQQHALKDFEKNKIN